MAESISISGDELGARVKQLVHEGNVRHIRIKHDGHTVLELPLTVGVVGALVAPQLAAVGAIGALLTRCTIEVEREPAAGEKAGAASPSPTGQTPPPGR